MIAFDFCFLFISYSLFHVSLVSFLF